MIHVHESTLALSVYRAVQRGGAMAPDQIIAFLRANWDPNFDAEDLAAALDYLRARSLVTVGDTVWSSRAVDGVAATVVRDPKRETELVFV